MQIDVTGWLGSLGLAQYVELFAANAIDAEVLPDLTDDELKELGVPLGHRKKLLKAIAELNGGAAATASVTETPASITAAAPTAKASESGERRQLTVLFCDMVGFTELANCVDPEVLQRIIRSYEDACAVCITRYEGYVFQRLGDGIVAFFGYPLAHEGEAERGLSEATSWLAEKYELGRGIPKDEAEANTLNARAADQVRRAAEQGNAVATFNLGVLYRIGKGVKKSDTEAAYWVVRSLKLGDKYLVSELMRNPTVLSEGDRKWLQEVLRDEGTYKGPINGTFSPDVRTAMEALGSKA